MRIDHSLVVEIKEGLNNFQASCVVCVGHARHVTQDFDWASKLQ